MSLKRASQDEINQGDQKKLRVKPVQKVLYELMNVIVETKIVRNNQRIVISL